MRRFALPIAIAAGTLLLAQPAANTKTKPIPEYTYAVVKMYPHDHRAFTEGLEYHDGFLYESTGLNGRSTLRKTRLETGEVVEKIDLDRQYFGEGITIIGNKIIQLTYQTEVGFVYTLDGFKLLRQFQYKGEGWSLTHNATEIFMDDGTPEIRVLDPASLAEKRRITVREGDTPLANVNELEYINGELWGNVWKTQRIARISPRTGAVLGWIDLTGILSPMYREGTEDVMNGIAWDAAGKRLFVTGKMWPKLFEIHIVPKTKK